MAYSINALSHYVNTQQNDWDLYIHQALYSMRTSINATTGKSPFEMLYGRKPTCMIDLMFDFKTDTVDPESYIGRLRSRLQIVHKEALDQQKIMKGKMKANFDSKIKRSNNYEIGDTVFLRNDAKVVGKSSKFLPKYLGPFKITERVNALDFRIKVMFLFFSYLLL
jgi:hypothetical protein